MTSIAGVASNPAAQMSGTTSLSGLQNQISTLQRQCADWAGCATTPPAERQKQQNILGEQIQSLQAKIEKIQQLSSSPDVSASKVVTSPNSIANIGDQISQSQTEVNRPIEGAVSGSVINIAV